MLAHTGQLRSCGQRADVEARHVVAQHAAVSEAHLAPVCVQGLHTAGLQPCSRGSGEPRQLEGELLQRVVPREPARHHAAVELPGAT
jgi:hypothetical protein